MTRTHDTDLVEKSATVRASTTGNNGRPMIKKAWQGIVSSAWLHCCRSGGRNRFVPASIAIPIHFRTKPQKRFPCGADPDWTDGGALQLCGLSMLSDAGAQFLCNSVCNLRINMQPLPDSVVAILREIDVEEEFGEGEILFAEVEND
jgi:hypothetical protein